ncbi:hypothetical protein VP01_1665g2 [Puccinia sorghi]|uniref:HIT domain-containing protein n=1 Tax=Puccinia sorghi TaxID=27349 RepID=A0A0L6VG61_9BASI|nr:hypothetical protein VP01_1665g2 [Puccinia sorghi]
MGWLDPRAHTRLLALRFLLGLVRSRSSGSTSLAMYQVVPPLDKRLRYPVQQPKGHGGNARGVHHEDPDEFPPDNAPGSLRRMSLTLKFSSFDVTNQAFYRTDHCFAIVNLKPIAPGHVLVIPRRTEAKRLADLSREEVADLFGSVQKIGSVMESVHKASSLTVAIQTMVFFNLYALLGRMVLSLDNRSVNRASHEEMRLTFPDNQITSQVPHLHVHVIPRRPDDFVPNDKIYDQLNRFDASIEKPSDKEGQVTQLKIDNEERVARKMEDMQAEATSLRQYFQD